MIDQIAYRWEDQFRAKPEIVSSCTMIVCSHPVHGVETFYLDADTWHSSICPLLTPYWINGYTVTLIPMG